MDLVTFLAARLDEDEAQAKGPPGWKLEHWTAVRYADKESGRNWRVDAEPRCVVDSVAREDARHIARHDPARVLREVEAGRKILQIHALDRDPCDAHDAWLRTVPCDTLLALAAVFSDHPDYREEWRP